MSPGDPRRDGTGWRCPCGKPLELCEAGPLGPLTTWALHACVNGHRWVAKVSAEGEHSWKRTGLPVEVE